MSPNPTRLWREMHSGDSRRIREGSAISGGSPISIPSMIDADALGADAAAELFPRRVDAGAEIARVSILDRETAAGLRETAKGWPAIAPDMPKRPGP